jgi:hypothetical protein
LRDRCPARWRAPSAAGGADADNPATRQPGRTRLKPYDIEVLRLRSMKHDKGLIEISIDALVMTRPLRDEGSDATCLRVPVEHARTLLILLKQQIAELDKLQPRSRRSGRC